MRISKLIFIFSVSFSVSLYAQFTNVTGKAFVNLIAPLSITAVSGDLDFGEIILTGSAQTKKIPPRAGELFLITGHPSKYVTISFNNVQLDNYQWALATGGKTGKMIFKPKVILNNGKVIKSGDSEKLIKNGGLGKLNVWVGGKIRIKRNQPQGDYIGLFVISVSY